MSAQRGQMSARWLALLAGLLAAILLPWAIIGDDLAAAAMAAARMLTERPWLAMALVVALLALDPLLPVPSSIVAVAGGSALGVWIGAVAIWIGLMAGVGLGYWLGSRPGRVLAARMVGDAALIGLDPMLRPLGPLALILSRPIPVLAEAVVILVGAARMPLGPVLTSTALANAAVAIAWAGLGATAAQTASIAPALAGVVAIPALAYAIWHIVRRQS